MPTPEERDAMRADDTSLDPKLLELVQKLDSEFTDARAKQCACTALYVNSLCPTHGPAFRRHIENRVEFPGAKE